MDSVEDRGDAYVSPEHGDSMHVVKHTSDALATRGCMARWENLSTERPAQAHYTWLRLLRPVRISGPPWHTSWLPVVS